MGRNLPHDSAIILAAGRAEEAHRRSGRLSNGGIAPVDFVADQLRRNNRQVDMVVGMVADFIAFRYFQPYQTRILFHLLADDKKSRRGMHPPQDIEKLERVDRMRAVVERQRDLRAARIAAQDLVEPAGLLTRILPLRQQSFVRPLRDRNTGGVVEGLRQHW